MYETSAIQAGYRETENGWVLVEDARETAWVDSISDLERKITMKKA
jgi:hypothetical protein